MPRWIQAKIKAAKEEEKNSSSNGSGRKVSSLTAGGLETVLERAVAKATSEDVSQIGDDEGTGDEFSGGGRSKRSLYSTGELSTSRGKKGKKD